MPVARLRTLAALVAPSALAFAFAACGLDILGADGEAPSPEIDAATPILPGQKEDGVAPLSSEDGGPRRATCAAAGIERAAPWPMLGGCVRHPGRTVHRGPHSRPNLIWEQRVVVDGSLPVIAADDTVYVPAARVGVVAFPPSGEGARALDAGGRVTHAPALGEGRAAYVGAASAIVALDKTDGGILWVYRTLADVETSLVLDDEGTVYGGALNGDLLAIADGGLRWMHNLGAQVRGSPALADGTVYAGTLARVAAFHQADGGKRWDTLVVGDVRAAPVVTDDGTTVIVGTDLGHLYALRATDGGRAWDVLTGAGFGSEQQPALGWDGTVYAAVQGALRAYDPADGGEKWRAALDGGVTPVTGVTVDSEGVIFFGTTGTMQAYSPEGERLWDVELTAVRGVIPTGFAIGRDGTLYVACSDGYLRAFRE